MPRRIPHAPGLVLAAFLSTTATDAVTAASDAGYSFPPPNIHAGAQGAGVGAAATALAAQPLTLDATLRLALLGSPELLHAYRAFGVTPADLLRAGLLEQPPGFNLRRDLLGLAAGTADSPAPHPGEQRAALAGRVLDAALEVGEAWYGLARLEADRETAGQLADAALAAERLARAQHSAGTLSALEAAAHTADRVQAEAERDAVQEELESAQARLARLAGLPPGDGQSLRTAGLPAPPAALPAWDDLEGHAWRSRLDARQAESRFRLAAGPRPLVRGGPNPTLRLPLLDRGNSLRQEPAVSEAELELFSLRRRVGEEIVAGLSRLRLAHDRAERIRTTLLPARAAVTGEALKHYNGMLIGPYDLLEARSRELEARRVWHAAAHDYGVALLRLEHAAGGLLPPATAAAPAAPPATPPAAAAAAATHAH